MKFRFHAVGSVPRIDQGLLVRLPEGIQDKRSLMQTIAKLLNFPSYFGHNWDALDEALADLSWVKESSVYLWHDDLPLKADSNQARAYLKVLDEVLRAPGRVSFEVTFPETERRVIEELFNSSM